MGNVPDLMQRIAGKSIPLEVSRAFASSGFLPDTVSLRNSSLVELASLRPKATALRSPASSSPTSSTASVSRLATSSSTFTSTRSRPYSPTCTRSRIPRAGVVATSFGTASLVALENCSRVADSSPLVDYCLAHLLRGIILRFIAHPESHTKPRPAKSPIPVKEADEQAFISFK